MKILSIATGLLACSLLLQDSAPAQDPGGRGRLRGGIDREEILKKFDKNGDGKLDKTEREAMRADGRHTAQAGFGLWSRDTTFGEDGYYIDTAYDQAATSFHILTTDGIRGRDILAD